MPHTSSNFTTIFLAGQNEVHNSGRSDVPYLCCKGNTKMEVPHPCFKAVVLLSPAQNVQYFFPLKITRLVISNYSPQNSQSCHSKYTNLRTCNLFSKRGPPCFTQCYGKLKLGKFSQALSFACISKLPIIFMTVKKAVLFIRMHGYTAV